MKPLPKRLRFILISCGILLSITYLLIPSVKSTAPISAVLEDQNGLLLNASIAEDGQWRFPPGDSIPEKFKRCIITYEDRRFFIHRGVDMISIARALYTNIRQGKQVQGGSTLTMQTVRLSSKNVRRSLFNKIRESLSAIKLERTVNKEKILELYAANAPFGGNVVGLETAAWRYYGRDAKHLSWGEMAALAVLPNAPSLVHPGKNREVLERKRNRLLDDLFQSRQIDSTTCLLAKAEPLPAVPLPLPQLAPHLLQRFREDPALRKAGISRIQTTVDRHVQQMVTDILFARSGHLQSNGINNAAALVLYVETGHVLAYVGNIYKPQFPGLESDVDVIKSPRSPGSTLKPILYAAALADGQILAHSLLPDVPTQIGGYTPQNFDRLYDGAVPASLALSRSLNIPAVKLLQQYKYPRFYDLLKQLGMTTLNRPADHYGLSLILGGSEATMWDLGRIYAGFARVLNQQKQHQGRALKSQFTNPVYHTNLAAPPPVLPAEELPALDAMSVWQTVQAMEEVMRPGEEGLWQQFSSSRRIAWKTGTSFGFRDGWAVGVTPSYVVVVWTGNTTGEGRAGLIGVQTAAPILFDIFKTLPPTRWFEEPMSDNYIAVCKQSGYRANIDCAETDTVAAGRMAFKAPLCPWHQIIQLDATGTFRVQDECANMSNRIQKKWFVLPPAMEWYYKQKHHDYQVLPPFLPGCEGTAATRQLDIIYPIQNAKIYVPLELSGTRGKTVFTATHRRPGARLFWHLDDAFIGETTGYHQMALNPTDGMHTLTVMDEQGERVSRRFEILAGKNKK